MQCVVVMPQPLPPTCTSFTFSFETGDLTASDEVKGNTVESNDFVSTNKLHVCRSVCINLHFTTTALFYHENFQVGKYDSLVQLLRYLHLDNSSWRVELASLHDRGLSSLELTSLCMMLLKVPLPDETGLLFDMECSH